MESGENILDAHVHRDAPKAPLSLSEIDEHVRRAIPLPAIDIDVFARMRRAVEVWSNPNPFDVMVEQFNRKYGHVVNGFPARRPSAGVVKLRRDLIEEESIETTDALDAILSYLEGTEEPLSDEQLALVLDGICDAIYVLVGTAQALGLPLAAGFAEVHRSNMTKTLCQREESQKYGTKTPKGADYSPADLQRVIRESEGR